MFAPNDFFDLSSFEHHAIFEDPRVRNVWDVLKLIDEYLETILQAQILGEVDPRAYLIGEQIYIAPGARVEAGAYIAGPAYIGAGSVVRHGAYIRGKALVGENCVVGHDTEVKNAIFLNGAKAGHFAYVGDSILGNKVNLGAGTKLANFKLRGTEIRLRVDGQIISTGLRKFGAILGDDVSLGCNTVCNPGALVGPRSGAHALSLVSGYHPAESLIS
jgi:NDP-sugar pyrophosphorylase family protein